MVLRYPRPTISALALLLAAPLAAQETPRPAPPAASPGASDQSPLRLAYKFPTGQTQRFRATFNSSITASTEGGEGVVGPFPDPTTVDVNGVFVYTEKVAGSREGAGLIVVTPEAFEANSTTKGQRTASRLVSGKLVVTRNGSPVPASGTSRELPFVSLPTGPTNLARIPNGEVKPVGNTGTAVGALPPVFHGSPVGTLVVFPEGPLKFGDRWETQVRHVHSLVGTSLPAAARTITLRLTHVLKGIQPAGRRRLAIIETVGESVEGFRDGAGDGQPGAAPATPSATETLVAVTYFDLDRGTVVALQFAADLTVVMAAPPAAPGAPPVPAGAIMRIDGQIGMRLAEVVEARAPVVPATPTPRKPPAPRPRRGR